MPLCICYRGDGSPGDHKSATLKPEVISELINEYQFTQREPLRETIVSALKEKPKILQRKTIIERVRQKLLDIIGTFDDR